MHDYIYKKSFYNAKAQFQAELSLIKQTRIGDSSRNLHKTTQANFNWSSPTMYFSLLLVTLCAAALQVFTVAGQYRQLLYAYLENYIDSI